MGLTIHWDIAVPENWTWDQVKLKLKDAREFAKTLPVLKVNRMHDLSGAQCLRTETRSPAVDSFLIDAGSGTASKNPWRPGDWEERTPDQIAGFTIYVANGCEPMTVGVTCFEEKISKRRKLEMNEKYKTLPMPPNWSAAFEDQIEHGESMKIFRSFMKKWGLVKLAVIPNQFRRVEWDSQIYGYTVGGRKFAIAGTVKGRYQSHRKGYGPSRPVLVIYDPVRGRRSCLQCEQIWFKTRVDEVAALKMFADPLFQADLDEILEGRDFLLPAVRTWHGFCKTQYASDPRCGGPNNFVRAHLSVCSMLEHLVVNGFKVTVKDEGKFWETKNIDHLLEECTDYNEMIAGITAALKNAMPPGQEFSIESAMDGNPDQMRLANAAITKGLAEKVQPIFGILGLLKDTLNHS